jgi:hypothetical protein
MFLFCPAFQELRERYIDHKYWNIPTFELFVELMTCHERAVIVSLSCFLYKAEYLRRNLLTETN